MKCRQDAGCTCSQNVLAKADGTQCPLQPRREGQGKGGGTREDVIFLIPDEPCAQKYARMVAISRAPGKKENVDRSLPGSSC